MPKTLEKPAIKRLVSATCDRRQLSVALQKIKPAIDNRSSHPVLTNVKVDFSDGELRLTGFNLSVAIEIAIPAQIEGEETLLFPFNFLADIVDASAGSECSLTIERTEEGNLTASYISASSKFKLPAQFADDYHELPEVEEGRSFEIEYESLVDLLSVGFAASDDISKAVLNGIHFTIDGSSLTAATTDGHRLTTVLVQLPHSEIEKASFNPNANEIAIAKGLFKEGETIEVAIADSHIRLSTASSSLICRLLEGQYPNYQQLIPRQFKQVFRVEKAAFLAVLRRVAIVAEKRQFDALETVWNPKTKTLTCKAEAPDVGEVDDSLECQLLSGSAGEFTVVFKSKYLIEGVKSLPGDAIEVSMNTFNSPVTLRPAGSDDRVYLIMPVQLQS